MRVANATKMDMVMAGCKTPSSLIVVTCGSSTRLLGLCYAETMCVGSRLGRLRWFVWIRLMTLETYPLDSPWDRCDY